MRSLFEDGCFYMVIFGINASIFLNNLPDLKLLKKITLQSLFFIFYFFLNSYNFLKNWTQNNNNNNNKTYFYFANLLN